MCAVRCGSAWWCEITLRVRERRLRTLADFLGSFQRKKREDAIKMVFPVCSMGRGSLSVCLDCQPDRWGLLSLHACLCVCSCVQNVCTYPYWQLSGRQFFQVFRKKGEVFWDIRPSKVTFWPTLQLQIFTVSCVTTWITMSSVWQLHLI